MEKELDELIARAASWQDKLENKDGGVTEDGDAEWLSLCQEICDKADDYNNGRWSEAWEDDEDDEDALLFADYDIDVEEMEMEGDDEDDIDDDDVDDDGWLD